MPYRPIVFRAAVEAFYSHSSQDAISGKNPGGAMRNRAAHIVALALFSCGVPVYATSYSSLVIPQGASVQIGAASENLSLAMQADGNLVLYQNGTALWASNTSGQNCGSNQCEAVFQADGNFVVYNGSTALWNSQTYGNPGATLILTDQLPHIEVVLNGSILWANAYVFSAGNLGMSEGSEVHIGSDFLAMQADGNLVMYQGSTPLWYTATGGQNCGANQCQAVFQSDGNFVVYNGSTALWNTGTWGNPWAQLVLSAGTPYVQVTGVLSPAHPAKEYIYLNGKAVAIENNPQ
jgi:hypothetical protein